MTRYIIQQEIAVVAQKYEDARDIACFINTWWIFISRKKVSSEEELEKLRPYVK